MTPLQAQFLKSRGQPVIIAGNSIVQMDRVPITHGAIQIRFISADGEPLQGVALQSSRGFIRLSDGTEVKRVNVWYERDLPSLIRHEISCPDGELKLWNIYKATSDEDRTRADAWTNNAGMFVEELSPTLRRYRCSDGLGDFCLNDLVFDISTAIPRGILIK